MSFFAFVALVVVFAALLHWHTKYIFLQLTAIEKRLERIADELGVEDEVDQPKK